MNTRRDLRQAYTLMRAQFGHQRWWPADSPFEVCVGAVLVQHTSWSNVQRTLAHIKQRGRLDARQLLALPEAELARLLHPCGYFNVKARRLRAFLQALIDQANGELDRFLSGPTPAVRQRLLAIPGIGPETADSMLLYAAEHLCFVIDAYTRRIFARHAWCPPNPSYDDLQTLCQSALGRSTDDRLDYWRDYHAQLVQVGKRYCRPREPRCDSCPLRPLLPVGNDPNRRCALEHYESKTPKNPGRNRSGTGKLVRRPDIDQGSE
jgi:endonuclease III related protein